MPKELEKKLFEQGRKKGLRGKALNAYVYGTLRRTGWKPSREKKAILDALILIKEYLSNEEREEQ